jgi:hypothetical protein
MSLVAAILATSGILGVCSQADRGTAARSQPSQPDRATSGMWVGAFGQAAENCARSADGLLSQ